MVASNDVIVVEALMRKVIASLPDPEADSLTYVLRFVNIN